MSTNKKVFLLIIVSTILRCVLAFFLELGNDEVYYWTYAQHLQWNYFDHPPMVAILIRIGTFNLHFHNELFVRSGAILCSAISTWLVFITCKNMLDKKAGWYAALLYTSSFYCSIIAGTFILPDSPQVLFWVWSTYLMVSIIRDEHPHRQSLLLLLLGLTIGLCMMSKVHGVFLWIGFGLYILFYDRSLFRKPALYFSLLITGLVISPILFWNIQNNSVTYSFHESRVDLFNKKVDPDDFLQQFVGWVIYNNPVNFVMYVMAIIGSFREKNLAARNYIHLLLMLGSPLIIVLLLLSLFNQTLPHWSGPAYTSILLLTASYFSQIHAQSQRLPAIFKAAALLFVAVIASGMWVTKNLPIQLGHTEERTRGDGDVILDITGWKQFAVELDSLYKTDIRLGIIHDKPFIISGKWFPAANLDYYVAQPLHLNLFAVGKLQDIHNYAWLNSERPALEKGSDAYFIYPSNYYHPPRQEVLDHFEIIDEPVVIPQFRSGIHTRNFVIIRMRHYKGGLPANGVINYRSLVPGD